MRRVLRPCTTNVQSARLGIDVLAVQADQRPFLRRYANLIQLIGAKTHLEKLAHTVRPKVDPKAKRAKLFDCLENNGGHTDLIKRQSQRQLTNASSCDKYGLIREWPTPFYRDPN